MSLVVVGSVAFDSIKTPHGAVDKALGGSAVHFSLASRLFAKTQLVGVVGKDFPDAHRELLSSRGIELSGLETVADGETFRWSGEYFADMNQRETLSVDLNVLEAFDPRLPAGYRSAPFVFLANGAPATQASVIDQIDGKPFVMADTMDLWIRIERDELNAVLERVNGLVLNDQEAFLLSDHKNLVQAGRWIADRYQLKIVVVKKGEHGCLVIWEGQEINLPAFPLGDVLDPTGAGDAFAGGAMGYLAQEGRTDLETFKRAIAWGTVTASFCCEGFGVNRIAELEESEARERFDRFRAMLQIG